MSNSVRKRKSIEHWKIIAFYLIIYDIVAINFSYFFGLLLRFDLAYSSIPENYLSAFLRFAPFYTAFSLIVFYVAHMYNSVWRFASFTELNRIFVATVVTTVFQVVGITTFYERMPGSYYIVGCISQFILTVAVRFMYRYITLERAKREKDAMATHRTMIIGAGAAGQMILRELKTSVKATAKPCCVIDDNPNKWGRLTEGVPIVGGRDSIMANVEKYNIDQILFAIPTARVEDRRVMSENDRAVADHKNDFKNYEYSLSKSNIDSGIKWYGSSLILESDTCVRDYFQVDSSHINEYTFEGIIGNNNNSIKLTPVEKTINGTVYYYVEVPDIKAQNLDQSIKVVVKRKGQLSNDIELQYNAFSYAYVISQDTATYQKTIDVTNAMYEYWKNAKAYVDNNNQSNA